MKNQNLTLEQLAEILNENLWVKGDLKRIYLDRGYNTKKMSTKTYVYQREDGTFEVSCYIDCPSQNYNWIKSQQQEVIDSVTEDIENAIEEYLATEVFVIVDENGKYIDYKGVETEACFAESFYSEDSAKRFIKNDLYGNVKAFIKIVEKQEWNNLSEQSRIVFDEKRKQFQAVEKLKQVEKVNIPYQKQEVKTIGLGKKLKHNRFGIGEVVAEDETRITLLFPEGEKQLVKAFAKLEEVSND